MDLTLIQGAVSSLKLASDIAQGFLKLKSISEVQGKVIDLQSAILAAQSNALAANSDQMTMVEEIRSLQEELAKIRAWEAEKQRYELKMLEAGIYAYTLKRGAAEGEPSHWLCSRCFNEGKKSLLQSQGDFYGATEYVCHGCQSKIKVKSDVAPEF